jgi:hypothetical protein
MGTISMLVSCLAYSLTLKMDSTRLSTENKINLDSWLFTGMITKVQLVVEVEKQYTYFLPAVTIQPDGDLKERR